jgi:elongation factor Ts
MDCKRALEAHDGDFELAKASLAEQAAQEAAKRADRETKEGKLGAYIHAGSRVGALVEINCETDFAAGTDEFEQLAHDLAMQVVAANPAYLRPEDVPAEVLNQEKANFKEDLEGKPEHIQERIIEGKLTKFYEEVCLMEQPFIKDADISIKELVQQKNALLGENIVVRRFARFEVGGQ